jgi:cytochrome oxidase Cu insertion factor (SCO1/SenC/PrrC family)
LKLSRYLILLACLFFLGNTAPAKDSIANSAEEVCPLLPGLEVPEVELTTVDGEPFALKSEIASQPTIIIFYRGSW